MYVSMYVCKYVCMYVLHNSDDIEIQFVFSASRIFQLCLGLICFAVSQLSVDFCLINRVDFF